MNKLTMLVAVFSLMIAAFANAESVETAATAPQVSEAPKPAQPQLSDNPKMQAEGKRVAALMEQLQKESDPEVRRKIMSEAMCPQ